MNAARLARLREELDRLDAGSFLVTNPTNVRWLSGFESSNAALVVGRERVVLATDYRYIEAARSVEGVELHEAERDVAVWLGTRLGELAEGPVAFESDNVTVARHEAIAAGGGGARPGDGNPARASRDEGRGGAGRDPAGGGSRDTRLRGGCRARPGRPHGAGPRLADRAHDARGRRRGGVLRRDRRRRAERGAAAPPSGRPRRAGGRARRRRRGRARGRVLLGLHADVRDGPAPGQARARVRGLPGGAGGRAHGDPRRT